MRDGSTAAAAAATYAPTVAPFESRISRDFCNTFRDLAAPYTTASSCRARSFSDSSSYLLLFLLFFF